MNAIPPLGSAGAGAFGTIQSPHLGAANPARITPGSGATQRIRNAMTIDVEEHFQVQAFAGCVSRQDWDSIGSRVERNTDQLLEQFDRAGVAATFFTLGCVAKRHPQMVRRIVAAGHELASHGWAHVLVHDQTPQEFALDIRQAKDMLEDIGGTAVSGYRAATFSISHRTPWAFDVLAAEGYRYSSSIYPVRHDLYGMPDAPRTPFRPTSSPLWEIPMTTVRLMERNLPCSGGGYFRLLPYWLFRRGLSRVNQTENNPGIFYLHPWEIDPAQPRIENASRLSKFRHYNNLSRTKDRLDRLLRDFAWDRMDRVYEYLLSQATPESTLGSEHSGFAITA